MKLFEILDDGQLQWQMKRNEVTSLPELWYEKEGKKPYKVSLVQRKTFQWYNENARHWFDRTEQYKSIDDLNTHSPIRKKSLPEISEEKASWLYDTKFVRLEINHNGTILEASIPLFNLTRLALNELRYEGNDSKDDVIRNVKRHVKDFVFHNFDHIQQKYGSAQYIEFTDTLAFSTEKMLENFVATRKYKAGEY